MVWQGLIILVNCTRFTIAASHYDILCRIGLDLAFDFLGQIVNYFTHLLGVLHYNGVGYFVYQHSVAFYDQQLLVLVLHRFPFFLTN